MQLNRNLQARILRALEEVYPDSLLVEALPNYSFDRAYMANLFYLQEHGLIEGGDIREPGQCRSMIDVQITKDGLDFLAEDGGLQAILGEEIIKLERDEIISALKEGAERNAPTLDSAFSSVESINNIELQLLKKLILNILKNTRTHQFENAELPGNDNT